jgi:hypothetical protein
MISRQFKIALKLNARPQYRIAHEAGVNPVILSQLITGYATVKKGDERIVRIGKILGLKPDECFQQEEAY